MTERFNEVWCYAPGSEGYYDPFDAPVRVYDAEGTLDPEEWVRDHGAVNFPDAIYFIYTKEEQMADRCRKEPHKIHVKLNLVTDKSYPCYCGIFDEDHTQGALRKLLTSSERR